jgi:hypothetical protein
MAKRTDYTPAKPYTPEQLSEIPRNFAMLSKPSLQTAYSEAVERCKLARDGRPPNAEHIRCWCRLGRNSEKRCNRKPDKIATIYAVLIFTTGGGLASEVPSI